MSEANADRASPVPSRVGLLIPSSNTTVEYEYNRFGPDSISWHVGRLPVTEVSVQAVAEQDADLEREAGKLGTAYPCFVILCQSAVGFIVGEAEERALMARIARASGAISLSAAASMVAAVRALGAKRIALATPFASGVDAAVGAYFMQAGFTLHPGAALGLSGNHGIAGVTAAQLTGLVQSVDAPDVDAIVVPGGNLRTMALVPQIEALLGKPVVVTNQACIWAVAGLLGLPVGATFGRLGDADLDVRVRRGLVNGA